MAIRNNTLPSPGKPGAKTRGLLEKWLQKNRLGLEIFLDAFCVVDADNQVVEFNEAFTELTGESYRKTLKIGDFCTLLKTQSCPIGCPARQIVASGKSIRIDELHGSTKAFSALQMIVGGVPIRSDSDVIGALLTIRNVTAESELQKKYDERKRESILDGLTQLYNKSYAEGMLLRLTKTAIRQGDTCKLSVVMCDIDHFKKVNDTYGHQAGDQVLAAVAKILKSQARETDIVGRFGGEEFVCVLAETDKAGAGVFAERFRTHVQQTKILHKGVHIPVTISLGTATYLPIGNDVDPAVAAKDLVNRADAALYYAKANGRNRCCQQESLSRDESKKAA